MRTSIQRRLFGVLGLFVVINAVLWSGLALLLAYVVEDEIIDRVLASQSQLVVESQASTGHLPPPALPELRLYTSKRDAPPALQAHISETQPGGEIFTDDRTHYHYRWIPLSEGGPVLLVAEVSSWLVVTLISPTLLLLALLGLAVATALGLAAVALIARFTTGPLRELTTAIGSEPRPSPLPHVDSGDEVGVLAQEMTLALDKLQEALAREQAFTRDISHELRTPLTTLRNALQLMPPDYRENDHVRQLQASSEELEDTLSTLLAMARAESSAVQTLRLRPLLESLLVERNTALAARQFELSLSVPDEACATGNVQLTRLLLGNLLDNALHYAHPARLSIQIDERGLCLENPQSPAEATRHDHSLRHGLGLAERLAAAQRWQLRSESDGPVFRARLSWRQ